MSKLVNNPAGPSNQDEMRVLLDILEQRQRLHMPTRDILSRIKLLNESRKQPGAGDLLLSRYELIRRIEGNEKSLLWYGFDKVADRVVGVNIWKRTAAEARQHDFPFKASRLSKIDPNLVEVYDVHPKHHPPFYVIEQLKDHLGTKVLEAGMAPEELLDCIMTVGRALEQIHKAGYVHTWVEPDAIRFRGNGEPLLWRIDRAIVQGTRCAPRISPFLSPEARLENFVPTPASDIYSLAATAVFAFSRGLDMARGPIQLIDKLPIPYRAREVLFVAMSEHPTDRFVRVADFCNALKDAFENNVRDAQLSHYALKLIPEVKQWKASTSWVAALMRRLAKDGLYLTDIQHDGDSGRRLIQASLPERLRDEYGTAPEILLLATDHAVTGRDIRAAKEELLRREFELDRDLLVVIDGQSGLEERLKNIVPRWGQRLPWPLEQGSFPPLGKQFRTHSFSYDIFEERDPIRGRQVIGRTQTISELIRHIKQGNAVGVYGLRKIGKTTTVYAALDKLDPPGNRTRPILPVARVDLGSVLERNLDGLCTRLNQELVKALSFWLSPEELVSGEKSPINTLAHYLTATSEKIDVPLCIVLDEYDLLFEDETGNPGFPEIERFFSLLRGFAQESGLLSLVLIGRDPTFLDRPTMSGRANPMLGWCRDFWLGPMSREDAETLLSGLGRRVRLEIGPKTLETAYAYTGGHPLLHRQFGSALLELAQTRLTESSRVDSDPLLERAVPAFMERQMVYTICLEVEHLFHSRYKDATVLLRKLVGATNQELKDGSYGESYQLLKRFGLVIEQADQTFIPKVIRRHFEKISAA